MNPKISVVIPIHNMEGGDFFLWRNINSILNQTFKDYEIVIVREGKIAANTNAAMNRASGEIIKILYLDDYLANESALQHIVDAFDQNTSWLATGCLHQRRGEKPHSPHFPEWSEDILTGNNKIGSPSVLAVRNEGRLDFDEHLDWLLDCDLYHRYNQQYGPPKLLSELDVVIGLGDHQLTSTLSDQAKQLEHNYLQQKYG